MSSEMPRGGPPVDHRAREAAAHAAVIHQAQHDGLTDLPNRGLLRARMAEALHDPIAPVALLLLDLDRFKEVNDTLGHLAGDSLLQQIGQRLRLAVLDTDLVARLGGDEYAVLLPATESSRAVDVAIDLQRVLRTPFVLDGHPHLIDVSIGIALAPLHGRDADSLLRCADIAMCQAKRSGAGPTVYRPDQERHRPDRLALLRELRRGIDRDELLLHYQPKLDLRDGTLVGVEALVRWQHPQRGFLSPGEFIPLAEEMGLIHPLTLWVLEAALRQHHAWRELGLDIPVAVNLSRRLLQDPRLGEIVGNLLARWDVAPTALILEITESSLMADPVRAGENLHQLRGLGVRMSIDDFGTGYSSLASLKNLPVDELKIDQSFVQAMATDASSRAIVRAIIDLADALKLRVVAEGVEDRATWDVLAGLGCDIAQGYLLSPPLAAAELPRWVAQAGPAWLGAAAQRLPEDPLQERIRDRGARLTAEEEFIARKQSEAALLVSEERNRLALQAAHMGTWDVDLVRGVRVWSVETEALFGLAPGGFDGSSAGFKKQVHPDDWPVVERENAAAKAEHRASANTYRTMWPDGTVHWIEEIGSPFYDNDDTLVRIAGTSIDVTERKLAEEALRVSEERNRLALQAARMSTWDWDVIHDTHTWSHEAAEYFGVASVVSERTFDSFKDTVHPDDWPALVAEEEAAQAERRDSITTYRTFLPDGSLRWIESRGRSLYAEDGALMRVTGTSMDITERKLAEEALRASEERFRLQYKGFPLPTYSWRRAGDDFVLQDFNDAAEAATGGRVGDWLGIRASDHYAGQPGMQASLNTCVDERRSVRRETSFRDLSTDTDRNLVVSYVFVPPHTVMVHTEDVTDLRHAEKQRTALAQSEKLRALGQMASGIAHDLNQSLMLVASYSELARQAAVQEPPNVAELEDLLATTTQAAMDGGETVKRLLLFARAAPEQNSQPVDLSRVLSDAGQLTAPRWRDAAQAAGRPIALHVETDGHPIVQGSAAQLRELMTNLIFNAVDALPSGGTIHLRVAAADGQGVIEVVDSGVGMSVQVQERVFEPFFTTKGEGGTGMGLAMVFGIVEQHGGHIDVRSAPGEGTTFRITLPLAAESAIRSASSSPPLQLAPPRPLRVLAVDDEPMITKAVKRILKPSGHVVTVAGSGEEALERLAEQAFDVVISDMGMGPGMNGWELAAAVRQRCPTVRFLLATGWGAAIDPAEARAKGVEAVLAKPYQPIDLLQALARTPDVAA